MKTKNIIFFLIVIVVGLFSFTNTDEIKNCYLSYKGSKILTAAAPERIPKDAPKFRKVNVKAAWAEISVMDGYRILYNNKKGVPFVNLKVELSDPKQYAKDTANLLENLKYLNSDSKDMETKGLIKLYFNGYRIYGISRNNIENGMTLGTFVMFPGNNTIVYFYFNNLKPEFRNFENLTDYKTQRNGFMGNYTSHLKNCSDK
jgi:hypothetical protein